MIRGGGQINLCFGMVKTLWAAGMEHLEQWLELKDGRVISL